MASFLPYYPISAAGLNQSYQPELRRSSARANKDASACRTFAPRETALLTLIVLAPAHCHYCGGLLLSRNQVMEDPLFVQ